MSDTKLDVVNEYFHRFYPPRTTLEENNPTMGPMGIVYRRVEGFNSVFPAMEMKDGFKVSVQGHAGAYSAPREDFADRYSMVECGFPSAREELLMPYIDGGEDTDPCETVYGYVPLRVIEEMIEKHGGLKP